MGCDLLNRQTLPPQHNRIANLCIGLCTPPVGTCLFLGCGVGKTTIAKITPFMIPFFLAMFVGLMLITYVPWIPMWLPRLLGL